VTGGLVQGFPQWFSAVEVRFSSGQVSSGAHPSCMRNHRFRAVQQPVQGDQPSGVRDHQFGSVQEPAGGSGDTIEVGALQGRLREAVQERALAKPFPESKADEAQLLEFLTAKGTFGPRDLQDRFGFSYEGALTRLKRLRAKGWVQRLEKGLWCLNRSGSSSGGGSETGSGGGSATGSANPSANPSGNAPGEGEGRKGGAVAEAEKEKPSPGGDLQAEFAALLQRYKVKADTAAMVAEHIVATQPDDVLENPERLAEALSEFSTDIPPLRRKQILKAWFARRGVEVPETALRTAGAPAEAGGAERPGRLYAVDEETGRIRAAREGEKALTWAEAKTLSDEIKKELAKEGKTPEAAEPPFIPTEDGGWTINPKARFGVAELLAWQALKRSEERGEPQDPYKLLAEQAATAKILRDAFGGGERRETALELIQMLGSLNLLRGPGEEMKQVAESIKALAEAVAAGPKESPELKALKEQLGEMKALRDQVAELQKALQEQREKALKGEIEALRGEIQRLSAELERSRREGMSANEYGILNKGLDVLDRRAAELGSVLRGYLGRLPPPRPQAEVEALGKAIRRQAEVEAELDRLGDLLFRHGRG